MTETVVRPEHWLLVEWWESKADHDAGAKPVTAHVIPSFGREHDCAERADECWCHAVVDGVYDGTLLILHNVHH